MPPWNEAVKVSILHPGYSIDELIIYSPERAEILEERQHEPVDALAPQRTGFN